MCQQCLWMFAGETWSCSIIFPCTLDYHRTTCFYVHYLRASVHRELLELAASVHGSFVQKIFKICSVPKYFKHLHFLYTSLSNSGDFLAPKPPMDNLWEKSFGVFPGWRLWSPVFFRWTWTKWNSINVFLRMLTSQDLGVTMGKESVKQWKIFGKNSAIGSPHGQQKPATRLLEFLSLISLCHVGRH